jgi:hypothetical protein
MRRIIVIAILALPLLASAETYRDIGPLDTLGDVKARFPNAQAKKLSPAWAQPTDAMYQFTGNGMSGTIVVNFYDSRPNFKKSLERSTEGAPNEYLQNLANQSDEEAMSVNWVRWIPDAPIPIQRLVLKYGPPEKSPFSDENYQPYREWEKKGVVAFLSDDEKNVIRIDFSFTNQEMRKAWFARYKVIPDWLKEEPAPTKKK